MATPYRPWTGQADVARGSGEWARRLSTQAGDLETAQSDITSIDGRVTALEGVTVPNVQGKRAAFSVSSSSSQDVTLTWASAFADTNYSVTVALYVASPTTASTLNAVVTTVAAGSVVVRVYNSYGGGQSGTVHAIGVHD